MNETMPRVSIGLPVYNGEQYLAETLDSLLAQTYDDFELIICDNGSTDGTEAICRDYAARYAHIRYERHEQNRGAAWNFNRTFALARGEFFKWTAADDLCAPTFLERCVQVLDQDPGVAVAFSRCQEIDDRGAVTKSYPSMAELGSPNLFRRFTAAIVGPQPFIPVFGLIRRDTLARTKLIGKYSGSDRPLIGELALRGRLYEIPEFLFFYRVHPQQSWGAGKSHHEQQSWYDPGRLRKITFPHWRLLFEHEHSIWRAPLRLDERIRLHGSILLWIRRKWRFLANNLLLRDAL
jgi:glycosyltransferase involved in cell wall biosynthesis